MVYQYFDVCTMECETTNPTTVKVENKDYFVYANTYHMWPEYTRELTETIADSIALSLLLPIPMVITIDIEGTLHPFVLISGLPIPMAMFVYWTGAAITGKNPDEKNNSYSRAMTTWWWSLPIKDHHKNFPPIPKRLEVHDDIITFAQKLVGGLYAGKSGKAIQQMLKDIDVEYAESYASPLVHQALSEPALASASTSTDESDRSSVAMASRF